MQAKSRKWVKQWLLRRAAVIGDISLLEVRRKGAMNGAGGGAMNGATPRFLYGCFKNSGTPQIIHFSRVFHYKPSILGYPYFWKHPYKHILFFPCFSMGVFFPPLHFWMFFLVQAVCFAGGANDCQHFLRF